MLFGQVFEAAADVVAVAAFVAFVVGLRVVGIDCGMKLLKMSFVEISLSSP